MTWCIYGLIGLAAFFILTIRITWLWYFSARDIKRRDIIYAPLLSILWFLTAILVIWFYLDDNLEINMDKTIFKGKKRDTENTHD